MKFERHLNSEVVAMVLADLKNAAKRGGLSRIETVAAIKLISGTGDGATLTMTSPWTPENKGLTAANKINRNPLIKEVYSTALTTLKPLGIKE